MIKSILKKAKKLLDKCLLNIKLKSKKSSIIEYDPNYFEKLNKIQPCPSGDIFANNNIEYKYDLQIIVPCYNVEQYVEDCILSVLNQKTKYSFIVTLVNDGSTDNTLNILKKYEDNEHIELIDQKNKGLSGARNSALKNMKAKYITFLDSDDMMCENSIECMLDAAFNNPDCDIVEGNYKELKKGKLIKKNEYKVDAVSKPTNLYGFPWGKLYKAELWKNYQFAEGYWFEDTILAFIIFYEAKKAFTIKQYIYIYRIRQGSITQTCKTSNKSIDSFYITELLMKNHNDLKFRCDYDYINQIRSQFLINMSRTRNCDEDVKKLSLIYMNDLLKKYIDLSLVKGDVFFDSIISLDLYKTFLFEKYWNL